ncbi:alpha/beta hydrolase [Candidatus Endoriftia persephonae]|uniref:Serine aminopeptidase S33 domain-containing protein n=2 Tax=Gammaproteobacteria TaxID=1236 RepID=G2FJ24_9GAMM|nr:alpha/beta hydrolase [Candidatus Endoriftia persephone]EGW53226.1 hypothetical protein TevJSym_bi00300 [endosymbiont of Tevnia jerichonana (vent Tica)]USF87141.1 alpha/beta hydrolase [Candidatus Endoriftia persephone]
MDHASPGFPRITGNAPIPMKQLLALLAAAYLLLTGYLYLNQRTLLYFTGATSPAAVPTNYTIEVNGLTLHGWLINPGANEAILYFGGNAEHIEYNIDQFSRILAGKSLYLIPYRGYGNNPGRPSEAALLADSEAIYDQIQPKHRQISLLGRSLGSAIAIHLASRRPITRLGLITPFDSVESVAARAYPLFPVRLLLKDRYLSSDKAEAITADTLILYAERDEVVPAVNTQALITALKTARVEAVQLSGTTHNNIAQHPDFSPLLHGFFRCPDSPADHPL